MSHTLPGPSKADPSDRIPVPPGPLETELRARMTPAEQGVFDEYLKAHLNRTGNIDVDIVCLFSRGLHLTLNWHRREAAAGRSRILGAMA